MVNDPSHVVVRPSRIADLLQFTAKVAISALVVSAAILFVADWIVGRLENSLAKTIIAVREEVLRTPDANQILRTLERDLSWAADPANDLPQDRKRKLANDLRVIVSRWRPVVEGVRDELRSPTYR